MKTAMKTRTRSRSTKRAPGKRWIRDVTTDSTYPPEGLFTRDAATIARKMASPRVSPRGIGSAIRMVQYFINRQGRRMPAARRKELEKAKRILQERRDAERDGNSRAEKASGRRSSRA